MTAARVETPSNIVLSCDEIDSEKTDTFSAFVSEQTHLRNPPLGLEDYLSLIKRLCRKYPDIFNDKLPAQSAKLPPFKITQIRDYGALLEIGLPFGYKRPEKNVKLNGSSMRCYCPVL